MFRPNHPRSPLVMPGLPQLPLHSPSQIVGTPYAMDAPPFEYPFPDATPSPPTSFPPLGSSPPRLSDVHPVSNASFSTLSSTSPPRVGANIMLSSMPNIATSYPASHQELPAFSHPKIRMVSPPPPPPGLMKKRFRWSLGLVGRRRSNGNESSTSPGSSPGVEATTVFSTSDPIDQKSSGFFGGEGGGYGDANGGQNKPKQIGSTSSSP